MHHLVGGHNFVAQLRQLNRPVGERFEGRCMELEVDGFHSSIRPLIPLLDALKEGNLAHFSSDDFADFA